MSSALSQLWYGPSAVRSTSVNEASERVVDSVEHERGDDHEREARDQERNEQPRGDDRYDERCVVGGQVREESRHDHR